MFNDTRVSLSTWEAALMDKGWARPPRLVRSNMPPPLTPRDPARLPTSMSTEIQQMVWVWLREVWYCCSITVPLDPALVLLNYILQAILCTPVCMWSRAGGLDSRGRLFEEPLKHDTLWDVAHSNTSWCTLLSAEEAAAIMLSKGYSSPNRSNNP